jgi:hypothetical protein
LRIDTCGNRLEQKSQRFGGQSALPLAWGSDSQEHASLFRDQAAADDVVACAAKLAVLQLPQP